MAILLNEYLKQYLQQNVSTSLTNSYVKILNNRIQIYKLLANAGLQPPKTDDYIYVDVFTDADGWLNTVDTAGTNSAFIGLPMSLVIIRIKQYIITDNILTLWELPISIFISKITLFFH